MPNMMVSDSAPTSTGRTARHIQLYQKKPYSRSFISVSVSYSLYLRALWGFFAFAIFPPHAAAL